MHIPPRRQCLVFKIKRWKPGGKSAVLSGSPVSSSETLALELGGVQSLCCLKLTELMETFKRPKSVPCKCWTISPEKPHPSLVLTADHQTTHQKTAPDPDWVLELHVGAPQPRRWEVTLYPDRNALRKHCSWALKFTLVLSNQTVNPQSAFFL